MGLMFSKGEIVNNFRLLPWIFGLSIPSFFCTTQMTSKWARREGLLVCLREGWRESRRLEGQVSPHLSLQRHICCYGICMWMQRSGCHLLSIWALLIGDSVPMVNPLQAPQQVHWGGGGGVGFLEISKVPSFLRLRLLTEGNCLH